MVTYFFSIEVWTMAGLVTYDVLCFIHLSSRKIHVVGVTMHPDQRWMMQIARHVTMADWGFLAPGQYLMHDRDSTFCLAFQWIIDDAGVKRLLLSPQSPKRFHPLSGTAWGLAEV